MIIALLLGCCVGTALGLLGGGGSVLAVPGLTEGLGLPAREAIATSLVVVGIASALAAAMQARSGHVRFRTALIFGLLGMPGALLGARIGSRLPGLFQLMLFATVMIFAGVRMLRGARKDEPESDEEAPTEVEPRTAGLPTIAAAAFATGVLTGVVGVGGGFLIVPALVLLVGLPMRQAIGSSLVVIALNAAAGSAGYLTQLKLEGEVVLPFVIGALVAAPAGAALGRRFAPETLRRIFGQGILLMAAFMILRRLPALIAGLSAGN